jgi:DNA-binding CsgD family transcriptional regulator
MSPPDAARRVPLALERDADPGVAEHFVATLPHLARATLLAASGRTEGAAEAAARALTLARRGAGLLELALALAVRARTSADKRDGRQLLDEARRIARACPDPGPLPVRLARIRIGPASPVAAVPSTGVAGAIVLSERERELLPLLAGTLSQREIGTVLHLSLNTVKTHGRLLFRKLGVSSRAEAVARARELGLLEALRGPGRLPSTEDHEHRPEQPEHRAVRQGEADPEHHLDREQDQRGDRSGPGPRPQQHPHAHLGDRDQQEGHEQRHRGGDAHPLERTMAVGRVAEERPDAVAAGDTGNGREARQAEPCGEHPAQHGCGTQHDGS